MNTIQKIIFISLILTSAIAWLLSIKQQSHMMNAMMTLDLITITVFTASWTAGMAAMMLPAITPIVLLYNRLIIGSNTLGEEKQKSISPYSFIGPKERKWSLPLSPSWSTSSYSIKIVLFVGCYLGVWALTGIGLLIAWSILMNSFLIGFDIRQIDIIYGILLIVSGIYQFSSLKKKCLGYCESPMSFFMRRWRGNSITGAFKMGTYHGLYCLGCCWPYFMLMVGLGWMNILWMTLFAGIIFAEKIWSKGIWIARIAGIAFVIIGMMSIMDIVTLQNDGNDNNNNRNNINNNNGMTMDKNDKNENRDMVDNMMMNMD
jgi:predicted metal-binding membrane protein